MAAAHSMPHHQFILALQHEPIPCAKPGCPGPVEVHDLSHVRDRVKVFEVRCLACGWQTQLGGREQVFPPWGDAAILMMADEHLMHQQPVCPFDSTPVVFHVASQPTPASQVPALLFLLRTTGGDGLAAGRGATVTQGC